MTLVIQRDIGTPDDLAASVQVASKRATGRHGFHNRIGDDVLGKDDHARLPVDDARVHPGLQGVSVQDFVAIVGQ